MLFKGLGLIEGVLLSRGALLLRLLRRDRRRLPLIGKERSSPVAASSPARASRSLTGRLVIERLPHVAADLLDQRIDERFVPKILDSPHDIKKASPGYPQSTRAKVLRNTELAVERVESELARQGQKPLLLGGNAAARLLPGIDRRDQRGIEPKPFAGSSEAGKKDPEQLVWGCEFCPGPGGVGTQSDGGVLRE